MPPVCTLCHHSDRAAIDAALVGGAGSLRNIAERFGTSAPTLLRHREHVHGSLVLAAKAEETTRADDLLGLLREGVTDARRLRAKAEDERDYRAAIACVKTLTDIVERLADIGERLARAEAAKAPEPKPTLTDVELVGAIETLLGRAVAREETAHVC